MSGPRALSHIHTVVLRADCRATVTRRITKVYCTLVSASLDNRLALARYSICTQQHMHKHEYICDASCMCLKRCDLGDADGPCSGVPWTVHLVSSARNSQLLRATGQTAWAVRTASHARVAERGGTWHAAVRRVQMISSADLRWWRERRGRRRRRPRARGRRRPRGWRRRPTG